MLDIVPLWIVISLLQVIRILDIIPPSPTTEDFEDVYIVQVSYSPFSSV